MLLLFLVCSLSISDNIIKSELFDFLLDRETREGDCCLVVLSLRFWVGDFEVASVRLFFLTSRDVPVELVWDLLGGFW